MQKTALKVISADKYLSYSHALNLLDLDSLSDRREQPTYDVHRLHWVDIALIMDKNHSGYSVLSMRLQFIVYSLGLNKIGIFH